MNAAWGILPAMISIAANYMVLFAGVCFAMDGNFTIGMITVFQGFLGAFMEPVDMLIGAGQMILEMRTDMERVEDVMQYPDDPFIVDESISKKEDYTKLSGNVELKNVTFGYSPLGEPVIKDFSMKLDPGSRVAIVGPSGCGKSTLSSLISGLYKPWSGEILFDGKPISEIHRSVFTGSVAVVDQEIILFEDTISANIRMWDESIEDFEVILAARDAQIHDDILRRPDGYQGKLTENGKDLSGGQRQRLEIARVLAQDPSIIILDEATSALDAKTEYDVVKAICDRGITCIVIAHRLSTIRDCDEIIVLEKGEVVERGTHDELYAAGGSYAELVTSE
jgi:ABC-type bacteriocin/lantibiotic exporter with double-glycine peptidase domain